MKAPSITVAQWMFSLWLILVAASVGSSCHERLRDGFAASSPGEAVTEGRLEPTVGGR